MFAGKQGFMTLRDLFRWAERYHKSSLGQGTFHDWDQHIADEGKLYSFLSGICMIKFKGLIVSMTDKQYDS